MGRQQYLDMDEIWKENFKLEKNESRKQRAFVFWFLLLVILEQTIKSYIKNPFKNYNFAFGLPFPFWLSAMLAGTGLLAACFYFFRNYSKVNTLHQIAWVLILAGGVSNFFERVVLGFVRDYIYIFSGVLNLADMYIILGIIILFFPERKTSET